MKKLIRGMYIWGLYILALPLFVIFMMMFMVWYAYTVIRKYTEIKDFVYYVGAMFDGFKQGHAVNMHWVKTGETYYEMIMRESQES